MQFNLEHSDKFKKELDDYEKILINVPDGLQKDEINDLIRQLKSEVRAIDTQHSELFAGRKLPTMVTDSRQKIIDLRRKISKKIDSWKKAQTA